jgi:FtsZ-interacting cell division protein ZipA
MIGIIIGAIFLIALVTAGLSNRGDLDRYQQLKNKRRFSGKRLTPDEREEMARLARKYWWW